MKKDFKKFSKEKLLSELKRAHLMIFLLAIGVGLLAIVNSTGTSVFSNALTYVFAAACGLIALISIFIFVRLSLK